MLLYAYTDRFSFICMNEKSNKNIFKTRLKYDFIYVPILMQFCHSKVPNHVISPRFRGHNARLIHQVYIYMNTSTHTYTERQTAIDTLDIMLYHSMYTHVHTLL